MYRLFVALPPPEIIRDQLLDLMDDGATLRWQDEEQLHLTLRFVGAVERPLANDLALELGEIAWPRPGGANDIAASWFTAWII